MTRDKAPIRKASNPKATIREVAQKAGVSVGTASRAMNAAPGVTDATRLAVKTAASELGYRPNAAARALRSRSSRLIGCLFSDLENPLYARLFATLQDVLAEEGFVTLISTTSNKVERERRTLATFAERGLDGIVIAPGHEQDAELNQMLADFAAPIFVIDRDLPVPTDRIGFDHPAAMQLAVTHLTGMGHRRILPVFTHFATRPGVMRTQAFDAALRAAGGKPIGKIMPKTANSTVFDEVCEVLARPDRPTAMVVQGTRVLGSTLNAIAYVGLRVPDDISLISIGDSDASAEHFPAITALSLDHVALVKIIADRLLARIRKEPGPAEFDHVLRYALVQRASCAPPSN